MAALELPLGVAPNDVQAFPVDFGHWLEPASGAEEQRVDRQGGRFGADLVFPPMEADAARVVVSRLSEAMFGATVKVTWPLLGVSQGSPGAPVVDGAGQSGALVNLKGLAPGYVIKEGFWLTFIDENGRGYLHNSRATVRVGSDGKVAAAIAPMLRWPFLDGATVLLAKPTIEGKVLAQPWKLPVNRRVQVGFTLREVA